MLSTRQRRAAKPVRNKTMGTKRIIKNYIYNTSYQLLLVITPLITAPYLSRVLGVTGLAISNYAYSLVSYFVLFGTLGSSLYGQREIAYYQNDPIKRTSILKEIIAFRMALVSLSIIIYIFTIIRSGGKYQTVYLIMLTELVGAAFDISWFFQGLEDFKKTVIRNVIVKIFGIALIFLLVKSPEDINMYAICMTVPTLIGNLSLWAYLPKYVAKSPFSIKEIFKYIKPMLWLFVPQAAIEIYTVLDKTMLGILSTNIDSVGYYTNAQHIVKTFMQLIISLGTVMMPAMASAFAKKKFDEIDKMLSGSFNFTFIFGCPMMFGIAAVANNFSIWFYGRNFAPVGPMMMAMSPVILFIGLSVVLGKQYLLPTKKQKIYTIAVITGACVNVVLNFILIRLFNGIGACIASVVAEFCVATVELIAVRKELPIGKYLKENARYLLFSVIMFLPAFFLGKLVSGVLGTLVQVFAGVTVYLLLLILSKDKWLMHYWKKITTKIKGQGSID